MFDVGFWELVLIAVVALLVIGPERLPRVARIAGLWMGRARRTLASVKAEIDRELKAEELKEILAKQARSNPLETILEEPEAATRTATQKPRTETAPAEDQPGTREGTHRDG
jgi:sec-independent protein translocase protein TatB